MLADIYDFVRTLGVPPPGMVLSCYEDYEIYLNDQYSWYWEGEEVVGVLRRGFGRKYEIRWKPGSLRLLNYQSFWMRKYESSIEATSGDAFTSSVWENKFRHRPCPASGRELVENLERASYQSGKFLIYETDENNRVILRWRKTDADC